MSLIDCFSNNIYVIDSSRENLYDSGGLSARHIKYVYSAMYRHFVISYNCKNIVVLFQVAKAFLRVIKGLYIEIPV